MIVLEISCFFREEKVNENKKLKRFLQHVDDFIKPFKLHTSTSLFMAVFQGLVLKSLIMRILSLLTIYETYLEPIERLWWSYFVKIVSS